MTWIATLFLIWRMIPSTSVFSHLILCWYLHFRQLTGKCLIYVKHTSDCRHTWLVTHTHTHTHTHLAICCHIYCNIHLMIVKTAEKCNACTRTECTKSFSHFENKYKHMQLSQMDSWLTKMADTQGTHSRGTAHAGRRSSIQQKSGSCCWYPSADNTEVSTILRWFLHKSEHYTLSYNADVICWRSGSPDEHKPL